MLWGRVHVQMLPHSSACTYINDQESRELATSTIKRAENSLRGSPTDHPLVHPAPTTLNFWV